jgi:hypothetical protein
MKTAKQFEEKYFKIHSEMISSILKNLENKGLKSFDLNPPLQYRRISEDEFDEITKVNFHSRTLTVENMYEAEEIELKHESLYILKCVLEQVEK